MVAALKNIWPIAVRGCMVASSAAAFVPILWSSLPDKPLSVEVIDSALQLPSFSSALKIMFSGSLKSLFVPVLATLNVLSYAAITIAPPAALVVQPMQLKRTSMRVANVDFSVHPAQYALFGENWTYVGPDAYLLQRVQNMLRVEDLAPWEPPSNCGSVCSYNVTYHAPALLCHDYTPEELHSGSDLDPSTVYHADFNISENYPTLNMAVWPTPPDYPWNINMTRIGTRCTFHVSEYAAAFGFQNNTHHAKLINSTVQSTNPLSGPSIGLSSTTPCSWSHSTDDPLSEVDDSCRSTYFEINTWAFIEAFGTLLAGTIRTNPQSMGFITNATNGLLLSSLFRLFRFDELSQFFAFKPPRFDPPISDPTSLGSVLEAIFARATLSLSTAGKGDIFLSLTEEAYALPFESRYVYTPRVLWLAYAGALITVAVPGLLACFFIWRGFVLTDETTLSRVLATTRGESLDVIERMKVSNIDNIVVRYERARVGNNPEDGMAFTVVSGWDECSSKLSLKEDMRLLSNAKTM